MRFYLDKNMIRKMASSPDVYRRGLSYFEDKRVSDIKIIEEGHMITAVVKGNAKDYCCIASFSKYGELLDYSCTCEAHIMWKGACKHSIALFINLFESQIEYAGEMQRKREVKNVLDIYEKNIFREIDELTHVPANALRIVPCFKFIQGGIYLSLTIGRSKQYVVKDISAFYMAFQNNSVLAYGKDQDFCHQFASLDKSSRELFKLLDREVKRYEYFNKMLGLSWYNTTMIKQRQLKLTKQGVDEFFELYTGDSVAADLQVSGNNIKVLKITASEPDLAIEASKDGTNALLKCDLKHWELIEGEKRHYALIKDELHPLGLDYYNAILPVFQAVKKSGNETIKFEGDDSIRFSTIIAPQLKKANAAKFEESFEEEPTGFTPKAYFDAEDDKVVCKVLFCYDGQEVNPLSAADSKINIQRNRPEEYLFIKNLLAHGFAANQSGEVYELFGEDLIYDFYHSENGIAGLKEKTEVYISESFENKSKKAYPKTSFGLKINGNLLELSIDSKGFDYIELADILESLKINKKYHKLKDGRFMDISYDGFETSMSLLSGLSLSPKDFKNNMVKIPVYRALYLDKLAEADATAFSYDEPLKKLLSDFKSDKRDVFPVPKSLENILRDYQKEGFIFLKTISKYGFGGILADDMGLGKTIQVIALLLSDKEETEKRGENPTKSIVVAPTSLIYNWEKEVQRFAPSLKTVVVAGTAVNRKEIIDGFTDGIIITTYDMLKRDIADYENRDFKYAIVDEAQNMKNPHTQNAKAAKLLKCSCKIALTGTPIENSLSELWSIFDFVMPGYLFNPSKFTEKYERPIMKQNGRNQQAAEAASTELKRLISPFILRRVKKDVLKELPPKIETTLIAEMTGEQKKVYAAWFLKAKGEIGSVVEGGKYKEKQIEILAILLRLRQICCHPGVFLENYRGGSGKLDTTIDAVNNCIESGSRILIFSQFTKMLDIISKELKKNGISHFYLDGATASKERMNMSERFNGGEKDVFLISLKAGGTGLNLTGADVVIHYDPWWNPAVMDQASDRAHRFGQDKTVQIFNIVAKDSIEEKIIALQGLKKQLSQDIIEDGGLVISKMTETEILSLFN